MRGFAAGADDYVINPIRFSLSREAKAG